MEGRRGEEERKEGRTERRESGGGLHTCIYHCHCREVIYLYLGSVNTVPPFSSSFFSCW